ncbi:transposase [Candidatus Omnitrophota bacterium]
MPRSVRYIIPDISHHAIQRGNNRQSIFFDKTDRLYFLSRLKEISKDENVLVGSYCLMTNHVHLLLYPKKEKGLIRLMKGLAQHYTQYVNRKYSRSGKLWENRYKLHLVDPRHEWVVSRYIENNPFRANIIKKAEDYRYSSAKANLLGKVDKIVTKDIAGSDKTAYREFFYDLEATNKEHISRLSSIIQQEKVLGSDRFIDWVEKRFKTCFKVRKIGRPKKLEK